jgi:hypothetical protein
VVTNKFKTGSLEAAQRHAAEAHAAALHVLAASVSAFRRAAEAHERVASANDKAAAAGIGDVAQHERQAALHRAAAAADWQRAERAQSVLSGPEWAGLGAISGGSGDSVPDSSTTLGENARRRARVPAPALRPDRGIKEPGAPVVPEGSSRA